MEIAKDDPRHYIIISSIFLAISYFMFVSALLWSLLSWITTARRILLDDIDSYANRTLRKSIRVVTVLVSLVLIGGLIIVIVFREQNLAADWLIIFFGIQSIVMTTFFLLCFLFYLCFTVPIKNRLTTREWVHDKSVKICFNIFWWLLMFSLLCVPMALLAATTSRVSVAREEDVHCGTPVLVSVIRMLSHSPRDNLLGLFVDIVAQVVDILALMVMFYLGWLFFRLAESHRRIETDDTLQAERRRRKRHEREEEEEEVRRDREGDTVIRIGEEAEGDERESLVTPPTQPYATDYAIPPDLHQPKKQGR